MKSLRRIGFGICPFIFNKSLMLIPKSVELVRNDTHFTTGLFAYAAGARSKFSFRISPPLGDRRLISAISPNPFLNAPLNERNGGASTIMRFKEFRSRSFLAAAISLRLRSRISSRKAMNTAKYQNHLHWRD